MKTLVVIRENSRDYRFVTTVTVGKVFRNIVDIVWAARNTLDCDDPTFRIAEAAFVTFPQYPVEAWRIFEHDIADWAVIVDCDDQRIYMGRCEDDERDGSVAFGESSNGIKWDKI